MHRRHVVLGSLALLLGPALSARAGDVKEYDAKAFAAAQDAGQSLVVFVFAPW